MTDVGIVGGGQLGRMLALAGHELASGALPLPDPSITRSRRCPRSSRRVRRCDRLAALAGRCDVVTYEFENVPVGAARFVESLRPVLPPAARSSLRRTGSPRRSSSPPSASGALPPSRRSTRCGASTTRSSASACPRCSRRGRLGYDGKGQAAIRTRRSPRPRGARRAAAHPRGVRAFERELSIIAVRGRDGSRAAYPPIENHPPRRHPAPPTRAAPGLDAQVQRAAESHGRLMGDFEYVGVLAIELFQVGDSLLATRWRRECTIRRTGRSRVPRRRSSRTICAPSAGCRSDRRMRSG